MNPLLKNQMAALISTRTASLGIAITRADKTILVEAMVLRLDHIGFLDRSNNNYSWKSLLLFFIFTVPWCSGS
uniref:Uncharacterized protein n=1 Tax=Salix viminalis TaxID=40686 RepID=A0A6N2L4H9_SALVM